MSDRSCEAPICVDALSRIEALAHHGFQLRLAGHFSSNRWRTTTGIPSLNASLTPAQLRDSVSAPIRVEIRTIAVCRGFSRRWQSAPGR